MSSRYRYNSQSYYNRSTGGQTNNPRVINRPYGVGYSSNQSDNVKSWAYNLMHSGYYVNDSLESMANQLTKNGYYVSQQPPQTKILITGYSSYNDDTIYNISSLNYAVSSTSISFKGTMFYIQHDGTLKYNAVIAQSESSKTISIPANTYYSNIIQTTYPVLFYHKIGDINVPLLAINDYYIQDSSYPAFYFYKESFEFDLPNN